MSWLASSDPLALLAISAGQINGPAQDSPADATTELDADQRFIQLGEPVPIVFARFRNSKGGILVSPGATEARYENDLSNSVTAYYHLVVSEGEIDSIPVKDVFQRACRVGSHVQTYSRRAGTWAPGNFVVQRAGYDLPQCPYYCGSIGLYPRMSTISFNVTIPDGFDQWRRQVHLFVRGGMHVTRLSDSIFGPSDSFADLILWLLQNVERVPATMIDASALSAADAFLEYYGLTCNMVLEESSSLPELMASMAPYFLLCDSNNDGKRGLRPLLPADNATGALNVGAIQPVYVFREDLIIADSLEIEYTSLADRKPFVVQALWRQQTESGIGLVRTLEMRYQGTAESGPYEVHDLSAFCTSELHAARVAAYTLAKRIFTTHTIRFSARPQNHSVLVQVGDIIVVGFDRQVTYFQPSSSSFFYQVARITKSADGSVEYEAVHFPADEQNRSLLALAVVSATGTGLQLPIYRSGVTCDTNSATDETLPEDEGIDPGDENDLDIGSGGTGSATGSVAVTPSLPAYDTGSTGDAGGQGNDTSTGGDGLDGDSPTLSGPGLAGQPLCVSDASGPVQWYADGAAIPGATDPCYTPGPGDIGKKIYATNGGVPSNETEIGYINPQFASGGGIKATITVSYVVDTEIRFCPDDSINTDTSGGNTVSYTFTYPIVSAEVYTFDAVNNTQIGAAQSYSISCGNNVYCPRNGNMRLVRGDGGSATVQFIWGSSYNTTTDRKYELFGSTSITSVKLTEDHPTYGKKGTEVLDLGLLEAITNGASKITLGQTVA